MGSGASRRGLDGVVVSKPVYWAVYPSIRRLWNPMMIPKHAVHSLYSAFSLALTLSVLLATTPAYAQDAEATSVALGDSERRRTGRLDMHRLSVAIERMEQGPFRIPAEGSVLFFPQTQLGFSSSLALSWPQAPDPARQLGKVFLASLASTAVSDLLGVYLLLGGGYGAFDDYDALAMAASVPLAVFGGAVGAKVAGASYGRAVFGSLVGLTTGGLLAAYTGGALFVVPLVHAAFITAVAGRS